jgi:hypothetical protein
LKANNTSPLKTFHFLCWNVKRKKISLSNRSRAYKENQELKEKGAQMKVAIDALEVVVRPQGVDGVADLLLSDASAIQKKMSLLSRKLFPLLDQGQRENPARKKKVLRAVEVVDHPPEGAEVAGLLQVDESAILKRLGPENSKPVPSLVRDQRENPARKKKVLRAIKVVVPLQGEVGVADRVVDREQDGLHALQETTHEVQQEWRLIQAILNNREKISHRQRTLQARLLLRHPRQYRIENPMKIGNPWKMYLDCMKRS